MDESAREWLRALAQRRPHGGVISVYLDVDPGDRGGGWHIALEHGLSDVVKSTPARIRQAVSEAADRVRARFPDGAPHRSGRAQVGFVDVGGPERDLWRGYQWSLRASRISHDAGPQLAPLIEILGQGEAIGVVVASLERALAFEWALGRLEALGDWELEVFSEDWRERKAPRRNPQASGTGTSAAGRDQYRQRLEHNRTRFLKDLGRVLAPRVKDRAWRRLLLFGEGDVPELVSAGLGSDATLTESVERDLVSMPQDEIARQVADRAMELNGRREAELVERVHAALGRGDRVAAGEEALSGALEQGRVDHLVIAAPNGPEPEPAAAARSVERLIAMGLATGAEITAVVSDAARARLEPLGGSAALLRF